MLFWVHGILLGNTGLEFKLSKQYWRAVVLFLTYLENRNYLSLKYATQNYVIFVL